MYFIELDAIINEIFLLISIFDRLLLVEIQPSFEC